jgi:hypothetical protein
MLRASVNTLSHRQKRNSRRLACLDTTLFDTYTLPFAPDGCKMSYRDYRELTIRE